MRIWIDKNIKVALMLTALLVIFFNNALISFINFERRAVIVAYKLVI